MASEPIKDPQLAKDLFALENLLEEKCDWLWAQARDREEDTPTRLVLRFIASNLELANEWAHGLRYKVDGK